MPTFMIFTDLRRLPLIVFRKVGILKYLTKLLKYRTRSFTFDYIFKEGHSDILNIEFITQMLLSKTYT